MNNQKWSAGVGEAPHRHCWNLRNRLFSSCPGIWNGQAGVGTDYSFRYNCHGESTGSFCVGTRGQFFWDGNKRTSMTLANKILIDAGTGMFPLRISTWNVLMIYCWITKMQEPAKRWKNTCMKMQFRVWRYNTSSSRQNCRNLRRISHRFSGFQTLVSHD